MNTEKLAVYLSDLQNEFGEINCGGCGHFALTLHAALLRQGIPSKIRTLTTKHVAIDLDVNNVVATLLEVAAPQACATYPNNHLWIEAEGVHFDSNGICYDTACIEDLKPELLSKWLTLTNHWNAGFRESNETFHTADELISELDNAIFDIVDSVLIEG